MAAGCADIRGSGQQPALPPPPIAAQEVEPAPAAPAPAAAAAPAELTPEEAALVRQLLRYADYAMAADQLVSPYPGSALANYDQILQLQPDNAEARRGLERIVERFLELAQTAARRQQFAAAQGMIDRAQLVDANHPGIAPAQAQIQLLASAERRVVRLDGGLLRDRHPTVRTTLQQAGKASRAADCLVEITARNDAEGRWIYQQLSGPEGSERVRAQLALGSPPRVELVCFAAPSRS